MRFLEKFKCGFKSPLVRDQTGAFGIGEFFRVEEGTPTRAKLHSGFLKRIK
jgi:hypothetical protein